MSIKRLYIIIAALFLMSWSPIDQIGGKFKGAPAQMNENISAGAKALIDKAFSDVDPSKVHDYHVHIVGTDEELGTMVNPRLLKWYHILDRIKTSVYLSGSGVDNISQANEQYINRLLSLIKAGNAKGKYHILAFDHNYNPDGTINDQKSEFYTSNEYMMRFAHQYPDIFIPVISVHPYRKDAIEELTKWAKLGVKWIKWLPNAQSIDPSDPRIDEYYQVMKKYNMILLTHVGDEKAVHAEEDQRFGNPLLFRRPLDMGVKVVMAHCASSGVNEDFDYPGKMASNFDLFLRLMDTPKYKGLLFGEISAMTQFNRVSNLVKLMDRPDLHERLVNGSDYPLPAINVIVQTRRLVKDGMITEIERGYLNEIYGYNPLLFDYVVKRTIKNPKTGERLSSKIFEENIDAR